MFIGIDLGTSSVKAILINSNQNTLASHTEPIELLNPKNGYYEQNPEEWIKATFLCFEKIKQEKPKEFEIVQSLAISGQMHGATLIDKNYNILRNCILWNDTRSMNECIEMTSIYPNIEEESGNIAMPGFTAPKILWIKKYEPEIFKKIYKVLLPKDYLRFRLSGDFFTDMSDASGTLWFNVKNRNWSSDLINLTSLSEDNMPKLVEGTECSTYIDKKVANKFGFKNDVIIAGGAGDQAAGAAGSGVIYSNQSVISLGTSGVYFSPTDDYSSNAQKAVHSFCHCIPNTWHHMSVMLSATNCLDWLCNTLSIDIKTALQNIEELSLNDSNFENLPFFLPYLSGERTPHNNANIRGSFHLINTSTSKEALLYSVLEGITFGIKNGFEIVEEINQSTTETYLVGGGSKSNFWANLLSAAINKQIIIGEDSNLGPSLGVARLAMISTNHFSNKDVFKKMPIKKETSIDERLSNILNKRYKTWTEIVSTNLKIADKLFIN